MQNEMTLDRLSEVRGLPVYDSQNDKIGNVEEIFYDEGTDQPEWIGIGTGFFGTKRVLVPVQGARLDNDGYYVNYTKAQVKDAPDVDSDEISQDLERELYSYYGIDLSQSRSDTVLPEGSGGTMSTGTTTSTRDMDVDRPVERDRDNQLVRSEEELRVGKRETEAGHVRLRKWVETEPVEASVELRRETAHVHREEINQPVSGARIGEQEIDVELRAEEAVVQKQVVAKERVSLEKDVEVETRTVSDQVRKERVEIEGEGIEDTNRPKR